jgi:chromosome segregation ATPase
VKNLQKDMENIQKNADKAVKQMEKQVSSLNGDLERVTEEKNQMESDLNSKLKNAENDRNDLQNMVEKKNEQLDDKQRRISELDDENVKLKQEMSVGFQKRDSELESTKQALIDMETERNHYRDENDKLMKTVNNLVAQAEKRSLDDQL